jgi:hypothetical protein
LADRWRLDFTLRVVRFDGLIFIVAASVLLPASQHQLPDHR